MRQGLSRVFWIATTLVVIVAAIGFAWRTEMGRLDGPSISSTPSSRVVTRREMRPTLDPARFVGKAQLAHQIARDIPDVLDGLYCYCGCDKTSGHKSLLSCYTDGHAAT
jgi:hypothetical protein